MAWADIIPEIWSARTVQLVRKAQTARAIVNTNYTGDIRQAGDTIHIAGEGPVTIATYTGANVSNQTYVPTDTSLSIDQQRAYNVRVPLVESRQATTEWMDRIVSRGAYGLADAADTYVYEQAAAGAGHTSYETATTPWSFSYANVSIDLPAFFASLMLKAEENNIETAGLTLVAPPALREIINRFFGTRDTGLADGFVQRGFAGNFFGIDVVISNNLDYQVGSPPVKNGICIPRGMGVALADSILETKVSQLEDNFGVNLLGLYVYGAGVYDSSRVIKVPFYDDGGLRFAS